MIVLNEDIKDLTNKVISEYLFLIKKNVSLQDILKIKFKKDIENSISDLIKTYLIKLESISPGSIDIFFDLLSPKDNATQGSFRLSTDNLIYLLHSYSDKDIAKLVYESLNLSGMSGKIVISNTFSNHDYDVVELTNGSFFPGLQPSLQVTNSKYLDPRVVCVDGFVESVSEINKLLEDASNLKETIFLFVRGLSNEVIHTIKVNNDRKTMSLLPIIAKYDIDGINILNDVAVVCGCDVISTHKGQLFSSIDVRSAPRISSIQVNDSGILIDNPSFSNNIDNHILFLQKKILSSENDAEKEVLTNRLKNLGTKRVSISLKNNNKIKERSFMIDQCLRAVKLATDHGVILYKGKYYPTSSFKAAQHYREKFFCLLNDLGSVVIG